MSLVPNGCLPPANIGYTITGMFIKALSKHDKLIDFWMQFSDRRLEIQSLFHPS